MLLVPLDMKKEKVTGTLCSLRDKKVITERGYKGTHKESYKNIWDTRMTERQKDGYTFNQIYEYMINS